MNRYSVISKGHTVQELEILAKQYGAVDIRYAPKSLQIMCSMDPEAARRLDELPGLVVKALKSVSTKCVEAKQISTPAVDIGATPTQLEPCYGALQGSLYSHWYEVGEALDPPITGIGGHCAVLDSGIRKTHRGLRGKVIYEYNQSNSPTVEDVFDHGTGVAYIMCGGIHAEGQDRGIGPGVVTSNIKVLDDDGSGSEENVILGLEKVIELIHNALDSGKKYPDPEIITAVNLSLGEDDDADPDNPLRVACRAAAEAHMSRTGYRMMVIAAAGNMGPGEGTIVCPACDPEVFAIGSCNFSPFQIAASSSRGPTKEGVVKPDAIFFGEYIQVASAVSDDSYVVKSGTSFASPYIVGAGFCGWDVARRVYGQDLTIDREGYVEFIKSISTKPAGGEVGVKDNTYGWGLPLAEKLVASLTGAAVPSLVLGGTVDIIVPIMTLGMMGMMMSGMAKSMKS